MTDKNTNNSSINQKTPDEKSINLNTNKELDEYDKYLKIELENFKKPTPKKFSIKNLEFIDNVEDPNSYNERNFIMDNEESNIEKNSNSIKENFDKSIKQNNSYNISNHEDYSSEREINNSLDKHNFLKNNETPNHIFNKNATHNFKNTSANDNSNDIILNNLNNENHLINNNNNNPNLFQNNVLARSENGNPNSKNFGNLDIMDSSNLNYNNNTNLNSNLNHQATKNRLLNYQNLNINTDLNDYLTDKNSNQPENNKINNYDNELIDDNEKYMFSNNIEYTNYNINTNYNQENLDNDNTVDIINSNKKQDTNKSNKRTNFDFFSHNANLANNLLQNNVNDINSLDEEINFNVVNNDYKNNRLNINEITNSNNSNLINYNVHNNDDNYIDYRDAFMREGKVHNDVFFLNDKVTEYDSILNNNNHNDFKKMNDNVDVESENIKYNYETNINEKLEQKLKKAALSLNNNNNFNNGYMFDFNSKKPAYDKAAYCSFTPKNIKTLSDQTLSNSELLLPTKNNNRSNNINIHEKINYNNEINNDKKYENNYNEEDLINNDNNNFANRKEDTVHIDDVKGLDNSIDKANFFNRSEYAENNQSHNMTQTERREDENNSSIQIQTNRDRKKWNLISEDIEKINNLEHNPNQNLDKNEELNIYRKPNDRISSNKAINISSNKNNDPPNNPISFNIQENNKNIKRIISNRGATREINISNNLLNNTANIFNQIISNPEYEVEVNPGYMTLHPDINNKNEHYEYVAFESSRNEHKLKALQQKIEEKIRQEYESKISEKEREISEKTKQEFEEAMKKLKNELEKNLDEEKRKMESDLEKKWEEKYESLIVECKSKLRTEKEKKLAETMYQKLKPVVEKEIYKKEYNKVEDKIRFEIEDKIKIEIKNKKAEELEKIKKKFEVYTKNKIDDIENNIRNRCKEQFENELKKETEKKEKEIKINYLNKFEGFKATVENQLKEEYGLKKKELMKEISEMKAKVYSQKCAENLKLQKINKIKDKLYKTELNTLQKAEKVEKILSSKSKEKNSINRKINNSGQKMNKNLEESYYQSEAQDSSFLQRRINPNKNNISVTNTNKDKFYSLEKNFYNENNNQQNSNLNTNRNYISSKKKDLMLNIDDNYENNIKIFNNLNMNSPSSAIEQNMSNNNFSGYIKEDFPSANNNNNSSYMGASRQNQINETPNHQKMNAVNLFELNRRLRCTPVTNNTSKRENSIIIKETPIITQEPKETKTLSENLNEIIEKNSKLNLPNSNENIPQIIYRKGYHNSNIKDPSISRIMSNQSPDKSISDTKNFPNSNTNKINSSSIIENNYQESVIKRAISPRSLNLNTNAQAPNIENNMSFMKAVNNLNNQGQGSELFNKNSVCVSLALEKNIPLSSMEFGKFLIKYIEKEENYRLLFEKEIKKIKDKIKKIFEKNNQSDHCLLDYILELWDKLEVSYSVRYRILMDFCKKNNPTEVYNVLDIETEFITDYFKNSQAIFTLIKNREKIKNKLQIKSNRNELSFEDKQRFKNLTTDIEKKVKAFKDKHKIPIVWRGLEYEWVKYLNLNFS